MACGPGDYALGQIDTDIHADHSTLLPYWGTVTVSVSQTAVCITEVSSVGRFVNLFTIIGLIENYKFIVYDKTRKVILVLGK